MDGDNVVEIIKSESETTDDTNTGISFEIMTYPADYTLETLHTKWNSRDIQILGFQRQFVWTKKQSSRLIESFMMGLPIPPIFLYQEENNKLSVIDGQQRLRSIISFFDNKFMNKGKSEEFKLKGLSEKSPYYNKSFEEFTDSDKLKLKNNVMRALITKQLSPNDNKISMYHIFERINTGGTPLKGQEVRNCICNGELNDLIIELNNYPAWRDIIGNQNPNLRMEDMELILRYMALFNNIEKYKKPMVDFLTVYMTENQHPTNEFLNREKERFKKTCDILIEKFGSKPLSKKGSQNPRGTLKTAFFDAVFTAFAKNINNIPIDIVDRMNILTSDEKFTRLISEATTDRSIIQNRITMSEKILFK